MAASKSTAKKAPKKPSAQVPAKKTTAKKTAAKSGDAAKSETGIKYSDKSAGQEHLIPIFNKLMELLQPYVKGSIQQKGGSGGQVGLVSEKSVVVEGRKKDEVYFAGVLIQKGYVGFYYMPAYTEADFKKVFTKPELLKLLKGKSCFHVKSLDDTLIAQIKEALKLGYDMYKKKGWVD